MPPTTLAPRSRIPTLKSKGKQATGGTAGSLWNRAPPAEESTSAGSLSKKRGTAALSATSHVSPNPKARKILRTNDNTATVEHLKRPRATSPPPPSSTRKRPRKSNHPPDFDYVPGTDEQHQTTPTPRRVTRQSLAAEENVEGDDPMDCLTGPGALDTSGDSPQQPIRARSTTAFDFTLNESRLMDGADAEISSGGLYSDLEEDENERAETSIARMAGMNAGKGAGKGKSRVSPAPHGMPSTGTRRRTSAASTSRRTSTTPSRPSQSAVASRQQSRSPNVSRRTSTGTTRQTSATPRRQSTTPTPRRRTEPKTLPPPVFTLTAAQARKEARLAAAQAEAEAKLRASLESDVGRLSVVGEEEEEGEEEEGDGNIDEGGADEENGEEEWQDKEGEGEDSDGPLVTASVYQSPRPSPHVDNSRVTTPRTGKTPGGGSSRRTTVTPGNKSKKLTPRAKSTSKRATPSQRSSSTLHVRWTPRSSGKRNPQPDPRSENEDEDGDEDRVGDVSLVSNRTRASVATSRRSSTANTSRRVSGSGNRSVAGQPEREEEEEAEEGGSRDYGSEGQASTPRGRNRSRGHDQDEARSRSISRTRSEVNSRKHSRSASSGSPVGRGRPSVPGLVSRLENASASTSKERNPLAPFSRPDSSVSTSRGDLSASLSRLNSSATSRKDSPTHRGAPTPKPTGANKSPMRVEVVLPAPSRRLSTGGAAPPTQRPVVSDKSERRTTLQQPTPDPSSLDRSPGLESGLTESAEERAPSDSTYQPSSEDPQDDDPLVGRPRDESGRFVARSSGSVSASLARSRKLAQLQRSPSGSSVSLGSFHYEKPRRGRRLSGSKPSGLRNVSSEGHRRFDAAQDNDHENTLTADPIGAPETDRSTAGLHNKTIRQDRSAPWSPPLNTRTPRVTIGSTPHHAFDFTPGSRFESSFRPLGSYAQSTPFVRGDRQSIFGQLNQGGESSPIPTGPSDLELDGDSSEPVIDRIPYSAKGKARDNGEGNEVVPESSQPPEPTQYREVSVDSSVVVAMSSPNRSLRTERPPTPRALRVSDLADSDEEQDAPSSPSAGRQSLSESIKGRGLSKILELRKQSWNRSNLPQDTSSREMTTQLDAASQQVLDSPLTQTHSVSSWPEAPTSATTVTSTGLGEVSKSLALGRASQIDVDTSDDDAPPHPTSVLQPQNDTEDEDERVVRGSVLEDYPLDKHSIHIPHSDGLGPQDYDASVHFDGPSRAPIRRSATPILRGRRPPSEHDDSDAELEYSEERPFADRGQRGRSTSISADSSGPEGEVDEPNLAEPEELEYDQSKQPSVGASRSPFSSQLGREASSRAPYIGHEQSTMRFAPSPSSSARSTSRSLSRPRDYYGPHRGIPGHSTFIGDRTTGLSRSQMMAEASMYENWEPPARRQLRPRKWTDHDWRMLAHYLRRVQKSQALERGLSSREEMDLMMVNVHAVVDRFMEEEAHGIKLEGEWARSEITGRAVYLIIKERHKKDGTWKSTALSDPSFSAILADMTRPRAVSEGPDEDLSGEPVLPAALSELPARSRAAASQLLTTSTPAVAYESDGHVSGTADEDEDGSEPEDLRYQTAPSQSKPPTTKQRSPKRSPVRQNVQITVMHQRTQEVRGVRLPQNMTVSDYSSFEVEETRQATPSTTFSRLIGSLSSIMGGRSQAHGKEPAATFPTLKPVSRNPIDLTHDEDEQPSFPTLNHVPTPARPTPARPKRQKHVEPKLDLPTLQHISPPRPAESPRVPRKKPMRRVASVRELAKSFEKMGEENRRDAEAARSRVGFGRSVSGPVGGSRVTDDGSPGLFEVPNNISRTTTGRTSPRKEATQQEPKDEVEVIELSDSSAVPRESIDL